MKKQTLLGVEPEPGLCNPDDDTYYLPKLKEAADECHCLVDRSCWALVTDENGWVYVRFVTFYAGNDESDMQVTLLFRSEGPAGGLRECRHTYWGEAGDGYVFYMNFAYVRAALDFLERYFDGD